MGFWHDERTDTDYTWDDQAIEVDISDNPIVHQLLDANGTVIRTWTARPPVGYRAP